jgi:cell division protein FtsL
MHGRIRLKVLLGLIVVVALFVAGVRIIPVYVRAYEFQDAMRPEARVFPSKWPAKTAAQVHEALYKKASSLQLPLRQDQI